MEEREEHNRDRKVENGQGNSEHKCQNEQAISQMTRLTFKILRTLSLLARLRDNLDRFASECAEEMFFHPIAMLSGDVDFDESLDALFSLINIGNIQLLAYASADASRVGLRLLRVRMGEWGCVIAIGVLGRVDRLAGWRTPFERAVRRVALARNGDEDLGCKSALWLLATEVRVVGVKRIRWGTMFRVGAGWIGSIPAMA